MSKPIVIYTHDLAADIIGMFEDVLDTQNVTLKSLEDDEKEPENQARIYGSTYSSLLDNIEDAIVTALQLMEIDQSKYVANKFSDN